MTIKIASDIHGAFDELHNQISPEDTLVLLGDYLDVLDYDDYSGMIAKFVPAEVIKEILESIAAGKLDEAKAAMDAHKMGQEQLFEKLTELAHERYQRLFAGIKCTTYLIWGNVDFPKVLKQYLKPNLHLVEADFLDIDGKHCGFVSGSPHMNFSFGMPGELSRHEYRKRLYSINKVDHLFVHPPPAITDLTFDTKAGRDEGGSEDLLAYIDAHKPKTVHFGHVHNPRKTSVIYNDETELINVGHFAKTHRLTILD